MKPWSWILLVIAGAGVVAMTHPFESACDEFDRKCAAWSQQPSQMVRTMACGFIALQLAANRDEQSCRSAVDRLDAAD